MTETIISLNGHRPTADVLPTDYKLWSYYATDGGILDSWMDTNGEDWTFVTGYERWHHWNGFFWDRAAGKGAPELWLLLQQIMFAMNAMAREMDVDDDEQEKFVKAMIRATSRSSGKVSSVEKMARSHRNIPADRINQGNTLNLRNGLLDLNTCELSKSGRDDYLTYRIEYDYDPDVTCPRWHKFLTEVIGRYDHDEETWIPDRPTIRLFQELVGYSLTTDASHEVMVWLAGPGGNGKTVAIRVIEALIGALSARINFHDLGLPGNYSLGRLPGKRIVWSTESERGRRIPEDVIKNIVSGETITARPIYGEEFEFQPVGTIWWAMNHRPVVKDTTRSLWRRLKLIPFERKITDDVKDTELIDKLLPEISGVLNWAFEGLERLREQGHFTDSDMVADATTQYQVDSNPVMLWMKEQTISGKWSPLKGLFKNWESWRYANGEEHLTINNFAREMQRLDVLGRRNSTNGDWSYEVGLMADPQVAAQMPVEEARQQTIKDMADEIPW